MFLCEASGLSVVLDMMYNFDTNKAGILAWNLKAYPFDYILFLNLPFCVYFQLKVAKTTSTH